MTTTRDMKTASLVKREHDESAAAKRVVVTASTGNTVSYEDTSFVSGDSPAILNVFSDLGRLGEGGYITNDGTGTFTVEISDDGTSYGGVHTVKNGETMTLDGLFVNKIRLTWVSDSSYRVLIGHNIKIEKTTLATGDIEIGSVEIKNATDDTRASVTTRGSKGAVGVEILDASGAQITSFGSATVALVGIPTISTQALPYSYYQQSSLISGYVFHGFTAPGGNPTTTTFKLLRETLSAGEVLFGSGLSTFIHQWSSTSLASISWS